MNYTKIIIGLFFLLLTISCKKNQTDNQIVKPSEVRPQEINYFLINNDDAIELEKSDLKITTEDYHVDNSYKLIMKKQNFTIIVLFSFYDFGNYDEYLVTLDNSNNEISKILVSYNSAPDGNMENYEYSNYRLSKKLELEVFNIKVKEDLEKNKIIKKDSLISKYIIDKKGKFLKR